MNPLARPLDAAPGLARPLRILAGLGAAVLLAGATFDPAATWPALLLVSLFGLGLGLAGLLVVAIHYTTGAGWDVVIRPLARVLGTLVPVFSGLALLAVSAGARVLYPAFGAQAAELQLGHFKTFWLEPGFFFARSVGYVLVWTLFALALGRRPRREEPWPRARRRALRWSAAYLPVFAVTVSLASVDWVVALEPRWYSTIFGVYQFAGLFVAGLAALILLVARLRTAGVLAGVITEDHLQDLGRLLFAMSTFWIYIWFSQYMLVWYGNLAEEATYFTLRSHGAWAPLFWASPVVNWVVPFLVLLPRRAKRSQKVLVQVSVLLLAGHGLDLYLSIYPPLHPAGPVADGWLAGIGLGAAALAVLLLRRALAGGPVVPVDDPLLAESLHHHV